MGRKEERLVTYWYERESKKEMMKIWVMVDPRESIYASSSMEILERRGSESKKKRKEKDLDYCCVWNEERDDAFCSSFLLT